MKNLKLVSILSLLLILLASSCLQPKKEKPMITVSILPQKYFAEKLVGKQMQVMCMVPSGSNPEAYDPSPNQLVQLNKSKAYLAIGNLGFELAWLSKLKQNHPELHIYNTSDSIHLIDGEGVTEGVSTKQMMHEHVGPDPHIWSSPRTSRQMVMNMYRAIVDVDARHKEYYTENLRTVLKEIDTLDSQLTQKLAKVKNRSFLIYHPALTYLARDYGLNQFSVEYNGKEPTPQHIRSLINVARKENVKVIFVQKEFDVKNASILSKETGSRIAVIDPMSYNWAKSLTDIVDALAK